MREEPAAAVGAGSLADADRDRIARTVSELEDRRYAAMLAADVDVLAELLSDELIYVHTSGDADTKASYLDAVRTGLVRYRHLERHQTSCAVRPESVICIGRQRGLTIFQGGPRPIDSAYLSAWTLEGERWQFAAWHATLHAPTR